MSGKNYLGECIGCDSQRHHRAGCPLADKTSADPRGPMRRIVAIVERSDGTAITCDCGHTYDRAQHFTYKIGADIRCIECLSSSNGDKNEPR
jgi:hypothetical protein